MKYAWMVNGDRRAPLKHALEPLLVGLAALLLVQSACLLAARNQLEPLTGWLAVQIGPIAALLLSGGGVCLPFPGLIPRMPARRSLAWAAGALALGAGAGALLVPGSPPASLAQPLAEPARTAWCLVWVGLIVPLVEEGYFRVLLQSALRERVGAVAAVPLAALGFALAHAAVGAFGFSFGLGLFFGLVFAVSGCAWAPIAAHAGWNLATIAVGAWGPAPALAGLAMVVGAGVLLACWRRRGGEA